jgi:alkaline phosphatase D
MRSLRLERILGERQARWLVDGLASSHATWKFVASDMPIGVQVPDGTAWEAVANGAAGPPSGREAELAWVLSELRRRRVRNVVWLTADVHYTAAHHYAPDRAAFTEFDPFWEFVSGPLHAARVRAQPPRPDVRSRGGVRAGPARSEHLAGAEFPALR